MNQLQDLDCMSQSMGIRDLARLLLLIGGVIALVGGLLGLAGGLVGAGPALAVIVGIASLVLYRQMSSDGVIVTLLILGLLLAAITGGLPSIGGIFVSVGALIALIVRYNRV